MTWTAAAALMFAGAFAVVLWAYLDARQDARAAHDAYEFEAEDHERTRRQLAVANQAARDHLTSLRVVLDAHATDIVLDPLGTDLWPEVSPLSVVKGGGRS